MEYTTLGSTGMEVSRLCLGCMSFGDPDWRDWVLDREESRPVVERAIDLGINFFDTANMYSTGESERILGDVLADYDRDAQVALAWILDTEWVDAPIVGTTSVEHLEEVVAALDLSLEAGDVEWLEEAYRPVRVSGPR